MNDVAEKITGIVEGTTKELYDRLLDAITDEELENFDIFFSVVDGMPSLNVYRTEVEDE